MAGAPQANRTELARRACEEFGWINPAGRLKEMSARVALLRLARGGWIELPPGRNGNGNGRWQGQRQATLPLQAVSVEGALRDLGPATLEVVGGKSASHRWNALVATYHYLGYTPMAGAQIRYFVRLGNEIVGCLGFGASAWKVACRDRFIGWDHPTREAHLANVINNSRFLILPGVNVRYLASHVLSLAARRVGEDFEQRYSIRPVLLETFVESERFRATSYRAANWQWLGRTQGRGKLDRRHEHRLPIKDVYVYPLERDFRRHLGVAS